MEKGSLEVDRTIMDINTIGTISLTKQVLPYMIQQQKGKIVVVSSALGKFGKRLNGKLDGSVAALVILAIIWYCFCSRDVLSIELTRSNSCGSGDRALIYMYPRS